MTSAEPAAPDLSIADLSTADLAIADTVAGAVGAGEPETAQEPAAAEGRTASDALGGVRMPAAPRSKARRRKDLRVDPIDAAAASEEDALLPGSSAIDSSDATTAS